VNEPSASTLLGSLRADGGRPAVLDCGGGSGTFAVPLAQAGATVTVVDISIDALATLTRRAAEGGVADRIVGLQGDLESQPDALAGQSFDLVLAHGILEVLDDSAAAFAVMAGVLAPGGVLSVLVTNPAAGVLSRALAGDVAAALRDFAELGDREARVGASSVRDLCARHGLHVEGVHGVGVFTELIPGQPLSGTIAGKGVPQLNVDLTPVPVKDGIDVNVYKVSIAIAPQAHQVFALKLASSSTR